MKKKKRFTLKKIATLGALGIAALAPVASETFEVSAKEMITNEVELASDSNYSIKLSNARATTSATDQHLTGTELLAAYTAGTTYRTLDNETVNQFLKRLPTKIKSFESANAFKELLNYLNSAECKELLSEFEGNELRKYVFKYDWMLQATLSDGSETDITSSFIITIEYDAGGDVSGYKVETNLGGAVDYVIDIWQSEDYAITSNGVGYEYDYNWFDLIGEHNSYDDFFENDIESLAWLPMDATLNIYDSSTSTYLDGMELGDGESGVLFSNVVNKSFSLKADINYASISGPSFIINVDRSLTLEEIKSELKATDPTEGDISDRIVISNNTYILTNGKIDVGNYSFTATVTDSSGNTTSKVFNIVVVDAVDPTISAEDIIVGTSERLTEEDIRSLFTVSDNYDNYPMLEIITDQYSANWNVPGDYTVVAKVTDTAGNSSECEIVITVEDDEVPELTGNNITIGNDQGLTESQILALFTVSDNVSAPNKITLTIENDEYSLNSNKPGTYTVNVKAVDEAGNYTYSSVKITVTDTTKPTINNPTKSTGNNILLSQADLKALFTVSDDVTATNNLIITILEDKYTANYSKPGTYTVKAQVADAAGNTATGTVTITVSDIIKPTISGTSKSVKNVTCLTQAELKALFTISDDTTATDDLTLAIINDEYTANYETPGAYTVTARVTDAAGNYSDATITITVGDGTKPTISGENLTTGNINKLSQADLKAQFTYSDDVTSIDDLTLVITEDNYSDNYKKPGIYTVTARVTDTSNNSSTCTITITVTDNTRPEMEATDLTTGNSNCLTQADLKAQFSYFDDVTSTSKLVFQIVEDNYSANYKKPGEYNVIARVTDEAGNYVESTLAITVKDTTKPTITGENLTVGNGAVLSATDLKAQFTYSDDVTATSSLTFNITTDNYSANYSKPGTYTVTARVTDAAGNSSEASIVITVEDTTNPTISAKNTNVSYTKKLSEAELKALFTISDDITETSNLTLTITKDNYTSVYQNLGSYTVTATVTDAAGNSATATATITVIDDVAPVISAPSGLEITTLDNLDEAAIRGYITVSDVKSGTITDYQLIDNDGYFSNTKLPGTYSFTINASDAAGNPASVTFSISVVDNDYPSITWNDSPYVIVIEEGDTLTKDMILNILLSSGQLDDVTVTQLNTVYLTDYSGVGTYKVEVLGIDNRTQRSIAFTNLIHVTDSDSTDITDIDKEELPGDTETPGDTEEPGDTSDDNSKKSNNPFVRFWNWYVDQFNNNAIGTILISLLSIIGMIALVVLIIKSFRR